MRSMMLEHKTFTEPARDGFLCPSWRVVALCPATSGSAFASLSIQYIQTDNR